MLPCSRRPAFRRGFTLIELLVVVTIIVVLLALLVPGIERAIYQAELAVCATHIHGINTGAQTYAVDHRSYYPYRYGVRNASWQPAHIKWGGIEGDPTTDLDQLDMRPMLRPYMPLNGLLNDPLARDIDIDGSNNDTTIFGPYYLWFGFQYRDGNGNNARRFKGMFKIGDRFDWQENAGDEHRSFSLLAGDYDVVRTNLNEINNGSHPDRDGVLGEEWGQDRPNPWVGEGLLGPAGGYITYSFWGGGPPNRGIVDNNYGYEDGSVNRHEVEVFDDDFFLVPRYSDNRAAAVAERVQLPKN